MLGKVCIIGLGKMGAAILRGLLEQAQYSTEQIIGINSSAGKSKSISNQYNIATFSNLGELSATELSTINTIILAFKPQQLAQWAKSVAELDLSDKRIISILAGVSSQKLSLLLHNKHIVRTMPNLGLSVGAGMTLVAESETATKTDIELTASLFDKMDESIIVPEAKIDKLGAISGCGPAFFALLSTELSRIAKDSGLSEAEAETIAVQTLYGTAQMLVENDGLTAAQLIANVASPGGTTQAALDSLAGDSFGNIINNAVNAAAKRSAELNSADE